MSDLTRLETVFLDQPEGVLRRDSPIEVEKLPFPLADLIGGDEELLLRQIAVAPAVVAARDAIFESEVGLDGHELLDIRRHHDRFGRSRQELDLEFASEDLANLVFATRQLDEGVGLTMGEIS